jgi:hypothetical protein
MLVIARNQLQRIVIFDKHGTALAVITATEVRNRDGRWDVRLGIDCGRDKLIQRDESLPPGLVNEAVQQWRTHKTMSPDLLVAHANTYALWLQREQPPRRLAVLSELQGRNPVLYTLILAQLERLQ